MPATDSATLIEFYSRAETAPLVMEFAADAGGDPDQYGAEDDSVDTLLSSGLGSALKIFTLRAIEFSFITDPEVARAAAAADVDWSAVADAAEQTLAAAVFDM